MLSPARAGRHQAEAFPVAQAARIHPNDAAGFFPRKALRQASGSRVKKFCERLCTLCQWGQGGCWCGTAKA